MRSELKPTCGGCGSDKIEQDGKGHGFCVACGRLQEVETRPDPSRQLCDNCAYRPNSPERQDEWGWMRHVEIHHHMDVPFYCHKGMEARLEESSLVFVPDPEGPKKQCAGWIAGQKALGRVK